MDVKKPYHLHFAQKKEVLEEQGSFGQGIFIDAGYEAGLRDGMEFLAERMNDQNALPFVPESDWCRIVILTLSSSLAKIPKVLHPR